ncbi:MAG: hypothetical protein B7Z55_19890 [Planctomycetales bacterium 12-60-4]|nr:MAG: hypothetical protein B7Z55_19890 [Planctomycetales bacterium 12-60-4]
MLPLEGRIPVGSPVVREGTLWMGCQNGEVLAVDRQTGRETQQALLPQSLSLGLMTIGDALWGIACDGTLYRLPTPVGGQP